MMTIRIQRDESRKQLQQLLKRVGKTELLPMLSSLNLKSIYTAYHDEKLAWMVMSWINEFPPFCLHFDIIMNPNYNESPIKEKLLSKLEGQNKSEIPLQTSIWKTASDLKEFYEKHGFVVLRETEDTLELGWCGTSREQCKGVILQLVQKQITHAKDNVYSFLQGEFDTTDPLQWWC